MTATQPVAARFVGQSVTRKEDRRLVTGHGQYVDDVVVPRMLHAAFLRGEVPRASITRVDASAARDLPGVVAVYTAAGGIQLLVGPPSSSVGQHM